MPFDARRMSFFAHLGELRRRLGISLAVVTVGSLIAYFFTPDIIHFVTAPVGLPGNLTVFNPLEAFMVRFKIGAIAAIIVTAPIWLYQFLAFVAPALKPTERRWFLPGLVAIVFFFFLGVTFCYSMILKISFAWLTSQGAGLFTLVPNARQWIDIVLYFLLGFGLAFETPVVILVLVKLKVLKAEALFREWRWAVVIISTIAAFATPDWSPFTMGALAIAMLILYFGAAFVAKYV
jgi:sec-independent protein translocase protein TatC